LLNVIDVLLINTDTEGGWAWLTLATESVRDELSPETIVNILTRFKIPQAKSEMKKRCLA